MDVERFIPCLIKTANNYVTKAREHFEANKSVFEKMNFLPEKFCPDGKRDHIHGLYEQRLNFVMESISSMLKQQRTAVSLLKRHS